MPSTTDQKIEAFHPDGMVDVETSVGTVRRQAYVGADGTVNAGPRDPYGNPVPEEAQQ